MSLRTSNRFSHKGDRPEYDYSSQQGNGIPYEARLVVDASDDLRETIYRYLKPDVASRLGESALKLGTVVPVRNDTHTQELQKIAEYERQLRDSPDLTGRRGFFLVDRWEPQVYKTTGELVFSVELALGAFAERIVRTPFFDKGDKSMVVSRAFTQGQLRPMDELRAINSEERARFQNENHAFVKGHPGLADQGYYVDNLRIENRPVQDQRLRLINGG